MNILFYSPLSNGRSKDTESVMEGLVKAGDQVFLLTQYSSPAYHEACTKIGVKCFSTSPEGTSGVLRKIRQVLFLVRFCKHHEIDVVYSQLEPANLIAVFAQYFTPTKIVAVRHHIDEVETTSTTRAHKVSMLIYKMARHIVVVSRRAKEYMIEREGTEPSKIYLFPLGYNFELWPEIDKTFVQQKRMQLNADLVLITAARLIAGKRVDLVLRLLSMLTKAHVNCKLIVLGEGEELENLKALSSTLGIEDRVCFEGYVNNVLDYLLVADILVHFSLIDSSPAIIKEAGLVSRPVIVCHHVGDCDDYISDGENGFLVNREEPLTEAFEKVEMYHKNKHQYERMGDKLRSSILDNFSIKSVLPLYQKLNRGEL